MQPESAESASRRAYRELRQAILERRLPSDLKVTEVGLAEMRKRMPFANLDNFAKNPAVQEFGSLLTVADMCRFVETKVEVSG